jgi:glycosyltransferase involved in cell wall biosynthesis
MPVVSVIVPTCNRPQMLAEALASVRAQTFTDYEIVVVSNYESAAVQHNSRKIAPYSGNRSGEL